MLDKLLALISISSLAGFVGILIYYVAEPDLAIVGIAVVLMGAFDFYLLTKSKPAKDEKSKG